MSVFKNIALSIQPIRRLYNDRERYAREVERLKAALFSKGDPAGFETLDAIGLRHGTDKASDENDFLTFYDRFLQPMRLKPVRVLEIGVLGGSSVLTWRDYFPLGQIVGADINPDAARHAGDRIRIELADQSSPEDLERLAALGPFDLVIDDGSHVWQHQILTLRTLMKALAPGGFYILEDLATSYGTYYRDYSGNGGMTAAQYLFQLTDWVIGHRQMGAIEQLDARLAEIWPTVSFISYSRGTAVIHKHGTR